MKKPLVGRRDANYKEDAKVIVRRDVDDIILSGLPSSDGDGHDRTIIFRTHPVLANMIAIVKSLLDNPLYDNNNSALLRTLLALGAKVIFERLKEDDETLEKKIEILRRLRSISAKEAESKLLKQTSGLKRKLVGETGADAEKTRDVLDLIKQVDSSIGDLFNV